MIDLKNVATVNTYKKRSRFLALFYSHLALLLFSSIARLIFYMVFKDGDHHFREIVTALKLGVLFDLRAVVLILMPSSLIVFFPWHPASYHFFVRCLNLLQVIFLAFYTFVLTVDFLHFAYMRARLNSSIIDTLPNTNISANMVIQTYPVFSGLLGLCVVTILLMTMIELIKRKYLYIGRYSLAFFPHKFERLLWLILILPLLYGKISYFPLRWSDAYFSTTPLINQIGLNPLVNFIESMKFKDEIYSRSKVESSYKLVTSFLEIPNPDEKNLNFKRTFTFPLKTTTTPPPHIIFIQMESLAFDKSSLSKNPLDPTPALKKISEEGIYFSQFFTPTEATARGVFAVLTGIADVTYDKSSSRNPRTSDHDLIFNQLNDYKKFYFLGGSANWGNIRALWTGNIKGINIYEEGSYASARVDVWGISDLDLFKEAFAILSKETTPTLSYIQTAGFHRPYTIPENNDGFIVRQDPTDKDIKDHGFLSHEEYNSMRFQDFSLGRFWEMIKKSPLYPNVIVAIYGDHGLPSAKSIHLPEGHYKHRINNHHVPLVIIAPGRIPATVDEKTVGSMVDIVPTVMTVAEIPFYTKTFGRNLLAERKDNNFAFLFSFHEKPKYISIVDAEYLWTDSPTLHGLFKYLSSEPFKDVSNENPDLVKKYNEMGNAIFETSKYMLYNNKK